MKRSLSTVLVITMLMTLFSGITIVSANNASTLSEIFSFDFDTDVTEFEQKITDHNKITNETRSSGTAKTNSTTYGIGAYRQFSAHSYIPLAVDKSGETPVYSGVERFTAPNKYMEIEYDYLPITRTNTNTDGFTTLGVGAVTYSGTTLGNNAFFGSAYHVHTPAAGTSLWSFEGDKNSVLNENGPTMDKWHRVRIVSQLTTDTLQSGSTTKYTLPTTTKCVKTYVDGVLINEKYYKDAVKNLTDEYVRAIRIQANYGWAGIDNLTVRTYQAGDEPVKKDTLVAAIRSFEEKYTTYTDYAEAVTLINAAKAIYESTTAEDTDVTAALANIEAAENIVNPKPVTYFSYDFNTDENVAAFKAAATSASTSIKEDDYYGIGNYIYVGSGSPYIPISPAISRPASENMYLEAEFDLLPVEPTGSQLISANNGNRAAVYFTSIKEDGSKTGAMSGIECNYAKPTNKECLNGALDGAKLKAFKYGQWYRCKVVCLLNDNGSTDNKAGLVKYYIDGNLVGTDDYYGNYTTVNYLRIYSNWSAIAVDNLSVRTYTADNPAPEKDVLVSKIRDFIKNYPEYTENAEALALFNQAEAVYKNADAEPADITTALGYLTQAERKLFNAEPLVRENFNGSPMYFFDTVSGTSYTSSATALPTGASYADDDTYLVTTALKLPAAAAVKNFNSVTLGTDASTKYITAECDINTADEVTVALSDSVKYTLTGNSTWTRVRFDINTVAKTYDVYVNGDKKVTGAAISESALSSLTVTGASELTLDNVTVYGFENTADVVSDKGALVTALRASKALLDADTMTEDETALMTKIFDKCTVVNERPTAAKADIDAAASKAAFYNTNLSAQMEDAISVVIPGVGKELENVVMNLNLHYGSQKGIVEYDEIFFDEECNKDFSDVEFFSTDGTKLHSRIESHGNYDFIEEDNLPKSKMLYLSDGRVVSKKSGYVQISSDNGVTWVSTGAQTSDVAFVDRNDNVYHYRLNDGENGPCPLYKASENSDGTWTNKLVISTSDLLNMTNNHSSQNGVNYDYDVTSGMFVEMAQDDDGYLYAGRYQQEWTGAVIYVSDESGENFVVADFRPDKQHTHSIHVNRHVYPNEVYVCIDDSFSQPLCYVTTDHLGYEEIKDDPDHQIPNKARSTGGREGYQFTEGNELGETRILMPANAIAQKIVAHAKEHTTQVPVPYGANDVFGVYFGLKEDRATAPEKFEYNEEMGKWYTIKNKTYYNENNGKTHHYSDNVYALGTGEANILGGPAVNKTTDIMDMNKYTPTLELPQLISRITSPAEGLLLAGGLSGGYAQYPQMSLSYDGGDTWERVYAYSDGYAYETGSGLGSFRRFGGPWYNEEDGTNHVLMYGFSNVLPSIRGIFGGNNYFGLSNILIPELPEDGVKIFVKAEKSQVNKVTSYYYGELEDGTSAIMSSKSASGEGDALKFPLSGDGKNHVFTFDINTEEETGIRAEITGSAKNGNKTIAAINFDCLSGTITVGDGQLYENSDISSGTFRVKLICNEEGQGKLYINDKLVCTVALETDYTELTAFKLVNFDLDGGKTPTEASPVVVYYSNVAYGEYDPSAGQYLLEKVTLQNSDGTSANALANGVTIKTATISKVDMDINASKLFACIYDTNTGEMANCVVVDVDGSGTYPINLTCDRDNAEMRFYLVQDLRTLIPVTLTNLIEEAAQ